MTNDLTYSAKGFLFTQQLEGCRLTAYQDVAGDRKIGYGHTGADVRPGLTSTHAEEIDLLPAGLVPSVEAAAQFGKSNRAGGQVVAGLQRCCETEEALFEEDDYSGTNST